MSRESNKSSEGIALEDKDQLEQLPEKHREEILKQYDLPNVKVNLFTILGYGTSLDFTLQIVGGLMSLGAGGALPLMTILIGNLTNLLGAIAAPGAQGVESLSSVEDFHEKVVRQSLILVYIGISVFVATYIGTMSWIITGERISRRIRIDYLRAVLRQNIAYFDRVGAGEITNRVSHDVDMIQDGISDKVALSLYSIGTFFSGFIIAYVRAWKLALILSCILPTLVIIIGGGGRMVAKASKRAIAGYSSAATVAEEVLSSVRTAQAFGTEDKLAATYDENLATAQVAGYRKSFAFALLMAAVMSSRYLLFGLGFWEGSRLISSGDLNVGLLINAVFAVLIGAFSMAQLMPRIQSFISATSAAQKVFQTIRRIPSIDSLDEGGLRPALKGDIQFSHVSFIYPSRPEVTVLKNVSLTIPEGKFTAIVGASGSGKSTIIHLLERFYDPVEGCITINGHDLKTLNVHHLRSSIKLVSQEPTLFASSIFENICDGMTESVRQKTDEEKREIVKKAAVAANADQFIQALPDGYETIVGERGFLMSGGQKQRIAIARAIVSDPQILLLDEATSALDTASERVVQEALDVAAASRTTVCIAHRLSTIRNADNIIVLSKGEILEQGTHDGLLAQNGMYANLVNAQHISSTADEEKTEWKVEEEEIEQANEPLEVLQRTVTQGTVEEKEPEPTNYSNFELVKKALRWNKGEYKWLTLGWACSISHAGVYPAQALLFAYFVGALLLYNVSALQSRADFLSIWWLVLAIVEFFALFVLNASFGYASEKMVRRIRYQSLRSITRQEIAYFDRPENSTGRLTNTLSQEATAMAGLSGNNLGTILTLIVDLVSVIILAISFAWKLGLVAMSLMPVQIFSGYFRFAMQRKLSDALRKAYARSADMACEQVAAIRTVASLNREPYILEEFEKSLQQPVHEAMLKTAKSTGVRTFMIGNAEFYAFSLCYQFLSLAIIFWYGSTLLANGEYSIVQFFVAFMSITIGGNTAGMIIGFAGDIAKAKLGAISVTRLLERKPKIDSWSDEGHRIDSLEHGHIIFRDLHFRYPTRPHVPVLRGFNMEVKPGQYVALVGASGCGKSTCVALIERFYEPHSGQVLVDGISVSNYHLSDYRKCISLVSQEPTLYQGTIRFNILLGSNETNPTDDALDQACKAANIFDFIQSLPEGYETMVGSKGMALSGGQKQRIAIARALIRNPKILLLDEATSSLDSESEIVVQQAIDKAAEGRTTVAIAHRLSTIQKADMIYVLEGGVAVERGRHDELVQRRGRYYEMVRLQELSKVG